MNSAELQQRIVELADFSPSPEADWIAKVEAAPVQVIAGAMLRWRGGGGVTNVPDPLVSRREAAQAVLQARLSHQLTNAATDLHATIDSYQRTASSQATRMLQLTWAIAALTATMLIGLAVQIWLAWPQPR